VCSLWLWILQRSGDGLHFIGQAFCCATGRCWDRNYSPLNIELVCFLLDNGILEVVAKATRSGKPKRWSKWNLDVTTRKLCPEFDHLSPRYPSKFCVVKFFCSQYFTKLIFFFKLQRSTFSTKLLSMWLVSKHLFSCCVKLTSGYGLFPAPFSVSYSPPCPTTGRAWTMWNSVSDSWQLSALKSFCSRFIFSFESNETSRYMPKGYNSCSDLEIPGFSSLNRIMSFLWSSPRCSQAVGALP
jgi:hypothetical protein